MDALLTAALILTCYGIHWLIFPDEWRRDNRSIRQNLSLWYGMCRNARGWRW